MSVEPPARGLHRAQNRHRLTPAAHRHRFSMSSARLERLRRNLLGRMVPWRPKPPRASSARSMPRNTYPPRRRGSSGVTGGSSWRPRWRSCWLPSPPSTSPTGRSNCRTRCRRSRPATSTTDTASELDPAARRGRPHDRAARADLGEPATRGDRHRGRRLLLASRRRHQGHHHRGVDRPGEARHGGRCLDDHPAAREERLRRPVHRERRRLLGIRRAAAFDQGEDPRGAPRRSSSRPNWARTRSWRST